MNAQTAEVMMRCYRAGKRPDSRLQKAVSFAEADPALRLKLSDQLEFDEEIVDAIHFIKPPDNLRKKLSEISATPHAVAGPLRSQMMNPAVLAAIAGLLLILGVTAFFVIDRMDKFPGRDSVERMVATANRISGADFEPVTTTTSQIGDWLYMRGFEGYEVPPGMESLPVMGARVFEMDGKRVAQMAVDRHESLVFEFRAADFGVQLPADGDWRVLSADEWIAAVCQHGGHCFVIAFRGEHEDMAEFLKTLGEK